MPTKLSLAEDKEKYLLERGYRPAEFTERWIENCPSEKGKKILAKEHLGAFTVWKFGHKTVQRYHPDFIRFL